MYLGDPAIGQGIGSVVQRMDLDMSGTKEKVPFKVHLISSINDSLRQSSRARSFNATHVLFGSALKIPSWYRGQRRRGLISIKVVQREILSTKNGLQHKHSSVLSKTMSSLSKVFNPGITYTV